MPNAVTATAVSDRVKQSFVIFDILTLKMLYGCTYMATVGIKGLSVLYFTKSEIDFR